MHHDVVIVGAGPVGATLALALRGADLRVLSVDARPRGETLRGDRSIALSHGARLIFERLGVWCRLVAEAGAVTPIASVDVSQANGFGHVRLEAREQSIPALGYVVAYRSLQSALDRALEHADVAVRYDASVTTVGRTSAYAAVQVAGDADAITCRLAVIADGSAGVVSGVRRRRNEYRQVALTGRVWTEPTQRGVAYERFTAEGPIALLPEGDHYGLVWTLPPDRAQAIGEWPDGRMLDALQEAFRGRAGRFVRIAARRAFPLALEVSTPTTARRVALIGNAAQALHPVAGQGFNLGLRDAWELARLIVTTAPDGIGSDAMLRAYSRQRRLDRGAGITFTHGLVRVFGSDDPLLRWARGAGLALLDAIPAAKVVFTRAMLFGMRV